MVSDEADEVADGLLRGGEAGLDAVVVAVEERLALQTVAVALARRAIVVVVVASMVEVAALHEA